MLTRVFRILLSFSARNDFVLDWRLVLNEFDVSNLLLRWRRNKEEERQNEEAKHERDMQQIASTGRFRHSHDVFGIYASALQQGCVVVSIANSKRNKG